MAAIQPSAPSPSVGREGEKLEFPLHPKQKLALTTTANEVLYGGAAGGGKSHLMRVAAIAWCMAVAGLQVYFFRRVLDDLIKTHIEGPQGLRVLLAPLVNEGWVTIVEDEIRFWNGSKIYLCHCKDDKHRFKYLGAEIHVLIVDELTTFSEVIYRFLRSRLRAAGLVVPASFPAGFFPRVLAGSNPGNVGHLWVKQTFIDEHRPLEAWQADDDEGGMRRQYIPAKLDDNPSIDRKSYVGKLKGLGSETLVKAMLDGDWDIVEGAFFDCWSAERHKIAPFAIPDHWLRFRSMDWGSYHPASVHWWAVVPDLFVTEQGDILPKGCLVAYREWYLKAKGQLNRGLKLTAEEVAAGIKKRQKEPEEKIMGSPADPAMFKQISGPSLAEVFADHGVFLEEADNERVPGWQQLRGRLVGVPNEIDPDEMLPMIVFFDTCFDAIRTLPALMHDEAKPEDVDTDGEDHAGDDVRYMCMARPWAGAPKKTKKKRRDRWAASEDDDERDETNARTA